MRRIEGGTLQRVKYLEFGGAEAFKPPHGRLKIFRSSILTYTALAMNIPIISQEQRLYSTGPWPFNLGIHYETPIAPRKSLSSPVSKMADPFEVRMRFTTQLQHLSASVTSSQKAAHYALKYRDMDEDLHSCILEQLEMVITLYTLLRQNKTKIEILK